MRVIYCLMCCSVCDLADGYLKHYGSSVDWEQPQIFNRLFSLYLGTVATPGKRAQSKVH